MRGNAFRLFPIFSATRGFSRLVVPKKYFFLDANIIMRYRLGQCQGLKEFVEHPNHQFFYTETVLEELQKKSSSLPEATPEESTDHFFNFVYSNIKPHHKESTLKLLNKLWAAEFSGSKKSILQQGLVLTPSQIEQFRKDIFIIFESGYSCHAPGVLPDDDFRTPPILTNNIRLLNKFIAKKETREILENAINLCGLEHLIPVQLIDDAIEEWQLEQGSKTYATKVTV